MPTIEQKSSPNLGLASLSIRLIFLTQFVAAHQLPLAAIQTLPETNSTQSVDLTTGGPLQNNTRRSEIASVNQICSSQRARNSSLCKPCRCNPNGSKSRHCDTYTRRCSCLSGYSGSTCNKCSPGYHNKPEANYSNQSLSNAIAGIDQDPLEDRAIGSVYCVPCDECYFEWRQSTSELKGSAVGLVERAHKLDQNYINQIGVATNETSPNLPVVNNRIMLSDIDQVVSRLGEQILDNKQKSDRLNLLSGELLFINDSFESHHSTLEALNIQVNELDITLVGLQGELELKSMSVGNISSSVAEFQHEVNNVQEQNPFVAPRLIERNRARTSKALTDVREMDQFSPLILTIGELDHKRERIESSKRQLDIIGTNILANYIDYQAQDNSISPQGMRFSSLDLESLSNSSINLQSTASSIAKLLLNRSDSYRSQYELRLGDMKDIRGDTELTNTSLSLSERLLKDGSNDQLGSDLADVLLDIDRLLSSSIKSNRASLDRIYAKESSAKDELSGLKLKLAELINSNTTLTNTVLEMDQTTNSNLSKLANFLEALPKEDLDELLTLKTQSTKLNQSGLQLRQSLLKLGHVHGETSQKASQTGVLIADIRSMISDLWVSGQNSTEFGIALKLSESSHQSPNQTSNNVDLNTRILVSRSQELLDRVQTYELRQIDQGMSSDRLIGTPITVDLTNTTIYRPASSRLASLRRSLAEIDKQGAGNSSDLDTIKTSDKRRLAHARSSLRQLALMLNEGLLMTYELAEDFAEHGQDLADQLKKIDELHYQMDSIINDLEDRYDLSDGCSIAQ